MTKYINSRARTPEVNPQRCTHPNYLANVIENFDEYVRNNESFPHIMLQFHSDSYKRVWRRFYVFNSTLTTEEHNKQLDALINRVESEIREELINDGECGSADTILQRMIWYLSKDQFDKLVAEYYELVRDCPTRFYRFYLNTPTYSTLTHMDVCMYDTGTQANLWKQIDKWKTTSKYLMSAWSENHSAETPFRDCMKFCDVSYEEISEAQYLYNYYNEKGERRITHTCVTMDELDRWDNEVENYKAMYNVV